jgi:hypothetical protein
MAAADRRAVRGRSALRPTLNAGKKIVILSGQELRQRADRSSNF